MTEAIDIVEMKQDGSLPVSANSAVSALRELLRFPFQDAEWRNKFLWGSGLVFLNFIIPILPTLAVGGYAMNVMRRAVRGE